MQEPSTHNGDDGKQLYMKYSLTCPEEWMIDRQSPCLGHGHCSQLLRPAEECPRLSTVSSLRGQLGQGLSGWQTRIIWWLRVCHEEVGVVMPSTRSFGARLSRVTPQRFTIPLWPNIYKPSDLQKDNVQVGYKNTQQQQVDFSPKPSQRQDTSHHNG